MHSQEVSSRTTPTDSKYVLLSSYSMFDYADLAQLRQTTTDNSSSKYHGAALTVTLPDWHVLLGTCKLRYIFSRLYALMGRCSTRSCASLTRQSRLWEALISVSGGASLVRHAPLSQTIYRWAGGIHPNTLSSTTLRKARR